MKRFLGVVMMLYVTLIGSVDAQAYLRLMSPVPTVVQSENAQLAFRFMLSKPMDAGSWIRLGFPKEGGMQVSKDVKKCVEADNQFQITACTANVDENYLQFTIKSALTLTEGSTTADFEIRASSAIDLPTTVATVDPITLTTQTSEVRATAFKATAGVLTKVSLKPAVETVGSDTTLRVSLTTAHRIPKKGLLHIGVSAPWNDGAPGRAIQYFSAVNCAALTIGGAPVAAGTYACSFLDESRVEITGGFPDGAPANTEIKVEIAGFRNPIQALDAFDVFTVYTSGADRTHTVDNSTAAVAVSEPAALTSASFRVAPVQPALLLARPGVVREPNVMDLKFHSPVPLRKGCRVKYWFPTAFYDASDIRSLRTGALLGQSKETYYPAATAEAGQKTFTVKDVPPAKDSQKVPGGYKEVAFTSCSTFRGQAAPETTRFFGLRQPPSTQPTPSVQVHLHDAAGEPIASVTTGVGFTPIAGTLTIEPPALTPTVISSLATMTWTIHPGHGLSAAASPSVTVVLPSDYVVQPTCTLPTTAGGAATRRCTVNQVENSITIEKFVAADVAGGAALSFEIGKVRLPGTTAGGKGEFQITTYIKDATSDRRYVVDTGAASALFTMTAGGFAAASVAPASKQAVVQTDYTFSVTPAHPIPQYGLIMVQYPDQIEIEDSSLSQTLCKSWKNFPSGTAVCTIFPANRTLIVNKGFQSGPGGAGGASIFSWVLPYVTNPTTLQETDSFKITTRDQYFSLIDEVTTGVTIQMTKAAEFRSERLVLGSYQNAARTSYSFSVVAATPIQPTDYILVTFPDSYELPDDEAELACKSSTTKFVSQLTCTKSSAGGKAILIELTNVKAIPALETLNFVIQQIMNPNSTYPTDPIRVQVFDSKALTRGTNQDTGSLVVVTSIPYTVGPGDASIESSVQGAGLASVYTLTMSLQHGLAAGGGLLVRYPPEMVHADDVKVTVDAREYGCPELLTKPELDYSARQILFVASPFTTALVVKPESVRKLQATPQTTSVGSKGGKSSKPPAAGVVDKGKATVEKKQTATTKNKTASKAQKKKEQKLTITIRGLANPYNNAASSSFEIVTFDSEKKASGTVLYFVDQVDGGLTIDSPCAFPCKECSSGAPTSCLACFPGSTYPLLQESTCLAACSDGRYFDSTTQRCELCDSTCLTCKGTAKTCTSCGVGEFLHLRGEECVARCGDGYIDDPSNNRCLKCREGCSTCSVSTTNCTSCEAAGATPWNFRFDCLAACPPKIGVEQGKQCLECSTKCKTCSGDPGTCTSCESYMRFDPLNNDCLEACQPQTQIYQEKTGECETCHENCKSCVEGVNTCTSCKADFVLNLDSTCKKECLGDAHQTPIAGTCRECEEPCSKCSGSVDTCVACIPGFLLYKGTCVDHCPDRYEENNAPVKQCILVGLICPAGFDVNEEGEGCVPKEFECKEGYEINEKRTACIPAPGSPVPFPFFFTAICLGLVVAGSYIKDKDGTKVCTCLIFLVSSLELLEYLLIAISAALLEQFFASFLAFVAVIVLVSSNIAFTVCYQRYTTKDKVYADWIRLFPKTEAALPVICALVNFSAIRFVFSGFFGMDNCLANFHEPRSAVHKHLQTLTYVKYVFVYIPIFIADILIMSFVGWGHQLLVLAIETFVLQLVTISLTFQEFKDPEKLYADRGEEYSPLKPKQHGQVVVMGACEEDGMDETHLVRQERVSNDYEVALRKKALTAILQQVGENFFTSQKKGVDIGGQISKVFSKFDKDQLKRRRAVSEDMTAERTNGTDGTAADDESDESTRSFIGEGFTRRYSFPMLGGIEDDVADPSFKEQLDKIKEAAFEEQYKDNVYADVKPESGKTQHQKKKKLVNRRTQTYLRELLQLDGEELQDSDMEIVMEEEAEIDDQYTKGIIKDLIEGISESSNRGSSMTGARKRFRKQKDIDRPLPDFELADIMGEFEIDDAGNYIILRGEAGELLDRHERLVNKRGYLVDKQGNIINANQEIILMAYELDADGEIPASCGFEKRKQNLLSMGDDDQFKVHTYGQGPGRSPGQDGESQNDEDMVERQFNALKRGEGASSRSGSQIEEPLAGGQSFMVDEHGNIDDMIDIITKKTVPVKKDALRANRGRGNSPGGVSRESGSKAAKKQQPAKRFRPGDQIYFPGQTAASHQDQKLQQITESIGGFGSGINEHLTGENMDLSEIQGRSQANYPGAGSEEQMYGSTQVRKAPLPIVTSDFYASGGPQEGSYSILSQDVVYLNDTLAPRPGAKGIKAPRDMAANELGQLRRAYGKDAIGKGRRADHSPKYMGTRSRQESQGARVFSADPRLRGLENIYLSKFSSHGSQKNIGLKKPFQSKKSRRGGASNLNTDDNSRARELRGMTNQRHALVSETIDRLEQAYQASGGGHQSAIGLRTEDLPEAHGQIPRLSQQDPHARTAARQASAHHPGPGMAPVRAQNWLASDAKDEF